MRTKTLAVSLMLGFSCVTATLGSEPPVGGPIILNDDDLAQYEKEHVEELTEEQKHEDRTRTRYERAFLERHRDELIEQQKEQAGLSRARTDLKQIIATLKDLVLVLNWEAYDLRRAAEDEYYYAESEALLRRADAKEREAIRRESELKEARRKLEIVESEIAQNRRDWEKRMKEQLKVQKLLAEDRISTDSVDQLLEGKDFETLVEGLE